MKKYTHVFFDLDHTLWHFDANAKITLEAIYNAYKLDSIGVNSFDVFYQNYLGHNEKLWERYRKGFINQETLRFKRMWLTLIDFKVANETLAKTLSQEFVNMLPTRNILFPHTHELLNYLENKNYYISLITNGFEDVQHKKLQNSNLTKYFKKIVTSETANSLKPQKEIFEFALKAADAHPAQSIMIGDSIEADILGAANVGIDQIFVDHVSSTSASTATYVVNSLIEIQDIL